MEQFSRSVAGAELNVAIGLSRLGLQDMPTDALRTVRHLHITGISPALSGSVHELNLAMQAPRADGG